jgi:hypothetical protein
MAWKKGPLPTEGVWGWGGVVPQGQRYNGFYFADFLGHSVVMSPGTGSERTLQAHEVAYYNNCLVLPPHPDAKRL